jgi:hypothetical protein
MTLRLLRLIARRPLSSLGVALALPLLAVLAVLSSRPSAPSLIGHRAPALADNPGDKLLVERAWFDRYPESPTETFSLWYLFDDGLGVYRQGSVYRFNIDLVGHAERGDKVTITTLQDDKKKEARFSVKECSDKPPFDLCLVFDQAPMGPAKYYGFKDTEQAARRMPWLHARALRP